MTEVPDDLKRVCFLFHKRNVKFLVIGARACALYGHVRATEDIDLLIRNDRENIENAIRTISVLREIQKQRSLQDSEQD